MWQKYELFFNYHTFYRKIFRKLSGIVFYIINNVYLCAKFMEEM